MSQPILLKNNSELIMILCALSILFILFIPIPATLLDLLLIVNFSWALTILLLTFYTDKPLSFSTFPALLLISTLFRLALNISATRLILAQAQAGKVIHAMGEYVIQGNYVMGLVVFLILIIVQFIVVTSGSQRIAEVAARFTLDSMPGKQMSIDADLNMGSISQEEAKQRRATIEKEANFYGAMDGASKFVKGDAIAGILIILVDIIGGFAIGIIQKGLSLSESIQTYTLLTVGDGLVTQIPALIISTATGIIVTRAATDSHLSNEITKQISAYPKSLMIVALALITLLFLKGIPAVPVLLCLGVLFIIISFARNKRSVIEEVNSERVEPLYQQIRFYPIELHLNPELHTALTLHESPIMNAMQHIREKIAFDLGFVIPELKIKIDKKLSAPNYYLSIQGHHSPINSLYTDKVLAIPSPRCSEETMLEGIDVHDPSYGLPSTWISLEKRQIALNSGFTVCEPLTVLTTHLNEYINMQLAYLLTREETEQLLLQPGIKSLSEELVPSQLSLTQIQRILQSLIHEKVSIRYLQHILELLLEHVKKTTDLVQLVELIRSGLAVPICQKLLANQESLSVLTLETNLEQKLNQAATKEFLALEAHTTEQFITSLAFEVEKMLNERKRPILLCSSSLRRHLKQLTQRVIPHLTVLAMNEIPVNIPIESFGVVK